MPRTAIDSVVPSLTMAVDSWPNLSEYRALVVAVIAELSPSFQSGRSRLSDWKRVAVTRPSTLLGGGTVVRTIPGNEFAVQAATRGGEAALGVQTMSSPTPFMP